MLDVLGGIVVVAGCVAYAIRSDFAHYSIFTVGVYKRLYRYKARNKDVDCEESYCDRTVVEGETRKACKEIVVLGCPLLRYNTVTNHYCDSHGSLEYRRGEYRETNTERLAETLLGGLAECIEWKHEQQQEKSAFSNATATTSDVFTLLSVGIVVLVATIVLAAGKSMAPDT